MTSFIREFKDFVIRGNAVELAVGIVIGTAFNAVINSLVKDIIMGTFATIAGEPDFNSLTYGAIHWGAFLNTVINLVIIGFTVFIVIKAVNKLTRKEIIRTTLEQK
jgi:large conductance mechanosensitive channel